MNKNFTLRQKRVKAPSKRIHGKHVTETTRGKQNVRSTATHISNSDDFVVACFLQAMEATQPSNNVYGTSWGKILAAAAAVADSQSAEHSLTRAQAVGGGRRRRRRRKITVNNYLMLSQRNKEGRRKKRVAGRTEDAIRRGRRRSE